jgi:hypothetical protein
MVMYIVYTEPVQNRVGHEPTGNEVRVFCRDFDEKAGVGKSKYFTTEMQHVIPSFDLKGSQIDEILAKHGKIFASSDDEGIDEKVDRLIYLLNEDHRTIEFIKKYYSKEKRVIHAILDDLHDKNSLPEYFLRQVTKIGKDGKSKPTRASFYSPSTYFRWLYPPFTIVEEKDGQLILPKKIKSVEKEIILADKKCALDIETTEYENPKLERITNVVLNFGNNEKNYIVTSFEGTEKMFEEYLLIYAKNTNEIKKNVERIIHEEDPLILYGFNIQFDQKKLRELGDEEYLPAVDFSKPIFKSVQGIKNMITRGRFTADTYGFLFLNKNIYKNNTLGTHAGVEKTLDHALLELKSYLAEQGDLKAALEVLKYVAEDGNITYRIGEENIDNIVSRALFTKRTLETICTSSAKAIMEDYWNKKFFFRMNTYRNRYEHGHNPLEFDPENKKDELLNLERNSCIEEKVSLVYPKFFINSMWDMVRGTTKTLRVETPYEKLNFCQTIHGYIMHALAEYFELKKEKPSPARIYAFESQYGIKFDTIDLLLKENFEKFNELLKDAGLVNFSKKFLCLKNPEQIEKEKLGFVFGTGPMISSGKKIVSLVDGRLIYQGFGLTRGKKTSFDSEFAEEVIKKRLLFVPEEEIIEFAKSKIDGLRDGSVPKEDLLFKKMLDGRRYDYGIVDGNDVHAMEFLTSDVLPDSGFYVENFKRAFWDVLSVDFRDLEGLEDVFK